MRRDDPGASRLDLGRAVLKPWILLLGALSISMGLPVTAPAQEAVIGRTHRLVDRGTPHPYVGTGGGAVVWDDEVVHPGSTFITLWFQDFSIAPGDYVVVRDPAGLEVYRYDSTSPSSFWSVSVFGDRAIVELVSVSGLSAPGFNLAGYGQGLLDPTCPPANLCGVDVECTPPNGAPPYPFRRPVCAIIWPGEPPGDLYQCSGYQIGDGRVLTNKHCQPGGGWAGNAEAWFNSERSACGTGLLKPISKYTVNQELCSSALKPQGLDYSLLMIAPADTTTPPPGFWGTLTLRDRAPVVNEMVWRFHHSFGCQKQYTDGTMTTAAPNNPCYWDYTANGAPGSSGSPVIAATDTAVVAHHGYAGTGQPNGCVPGKGSAMVSVVADMRAKGCLPGDVVLTGGGPTPVCFGDGTGTACPCGNLDGNCAGCANSSGVGAVHRSAGRLSVGASDLVLIADRVRPGQPGLFFQGNNALSGGNGAAFGDGLRCCGGGVVRLEIVIPNANGHARSTVNIAATGGVNPGDMRCYQFWYRDPGGSPCGTGFNLSNALVGTWTP